MDIDIEKLAKTVAESLNLKDFKGDVVGVKVVENQFDNVENGGIGIQINNGGMPQGKDKTGTSKGGRPKRTDTTINKAFVYDAGEDTNTRLQLFLRGLISLKWIKEDTDLRDFLNLFSGGDTTCRIVWTGDINALTYLFKELVKVKKIVRLPEGESIWVMVNARFWDHEGNHEFGNERLGATHLPIELKDDIDQLVEILNPKISLDEIKEKMHRQ